MYTNPGLPILSPNRVISRQWYKIKWSNLKVNLRAASAVAWLIGDSSSKVASHFPRIGGNDGGGGDGYDDTATTSHSDNHETFTCIYIVKARKHTPPVFNGSFGSFPP